MMFSSVRRTLTFTAFALTLGAANVGASFFNAPVAAALPCRGCDPGTGGYGDHVNPQPVAPNPQPQMGGPLNTVGTAVASDHASATVPMNLTATCPGGQKAWTGHTDVGFYSGPGAALHVIKNAPTDDGNGWTASVTSEWGFGAYRMTVTAFCTDTPNVQVTSASVSHGQSHLDTSVDCAPGSKWARSGGYEYHAYTTFNSQNSIQVLLNQTTPPGTGWFVATATSDPSPVGAYELTTYAVCA